MSFIEKVHQNPGAVTNRLTNWSNVQKNDLVLKTINDKMDQLYEIIYKSSPVRTGYMRSTLKVTAGEGFVQIAVTAYYARFVEKGTKRNTAHPFFFPNVASFSVDIIIAVRQMFTTMH